MEIYALYGQIRITVYHYVHSMRMRGLTWSHCLYHSSFPLGQSNTLNLLSRFTSVDETKELTRTVEDGQRAYRRGRHSFTNLSLHELTQRLHFFINTSNSLLKPSFFMLIDLIVVEFDNQFITHSTLQIDLLLQPRNLSHRVNRSMCTSKRRIPTDFTVKSLLSLADRQIRKQLGCELSGLNI